MDGDPAYSEHCLDSWQITVLYVTNITLYVSYTSIIIIITIIIIIIIIEGVVLEQNLLYLLYFIVI